MQSSNMLVSLAFLWLASGGANAESLGASSLSASFSPLLGLQRHVEVKRGQAPVQEDSSGEGGGEGTESVVPQTNLTAGVASGAAPGFLEERETPSASLLGLQQSTRVSRGTVVVEDESPDAEVNATAASQSSKAGGGSLRSNRRSAAAVDAGTASEAAAAVQLDSGSVLGMQRSTQLGRKQAAPSEEASPRPSRPSPALSAALQLEEGGEARDGIRLADVSVLGLQRSARVIRRKVRAVEDK
eukprot:CAMPEP_0170653654 /NCGR_PEP_ID=MMETSP0224-20130122/47517_1 /TAXON_ID=285029 /ORGANISM="Togula jolla, Strain CCCM 725" /LENGTH=242 /DNA_ID=CAMNT_0010985529 /DNA_START=64 /DNA_END=792 /DNA_ORIENTATION=-